MKSGGKYRREWRDMPRKRLKAHDLAGHAFDDKDAAAEASGETQRKKGKYSTEESTAVVEAAKRMAERLGLADVAALLSRASSSKNEKMEPFRELAATHFPERTALSLYSHVKRQCHPGAQKGTWSDDDTARLRELYEEHGPNWAEFADELGRTPENCRDRFRQVFGDALQSTRPVALSKRQRWSDDEVHRLITAKVDGVPLLDVDDPSTISFVRLSRRVRTRGKQQCQRKWEQLKRDRGHLPPKHHLLQDPAHQLELCQNVKRQLRDAAADASSEADVVWTRLGYDPVGCGTTFARACYNKLRAQYPAHLPFTRALDAIIADLTAKVHADMLDHWDREDASEAAQLAMLQHQRADNCAPR